MRLFSQAVESVSYRLEDLKSGTVKVRQPLHATCWGFNDYQQIFRVLEA